MTVLWQLAHCRRFLRWHFFSSCEEPYVVGTLTTLTICSHTDKVTEEEGQGQFQDEDSCLGSLVRKLRWIYLIPFIYHLGIWVFLHWEGELWWMRQTMVKQEFHILVLDHVLSQTFLCGIVNSLFVLWKLLPWFASIMEMKTRFSSLMQPRMNPIRSQFPQVSNVKHLTTGSQKAVWLQWGLWTRPG